MPQQQLPAGQLTHLADGTPLANVWLRLVARILDSFIVSAISLVVSLPIFFLFGGMMTAGASMNQRNSDAATGLMLGGMFLLYFLMFAVTLVVLYFYVIWRTRKVGATLGKQVLGLRIRPVQADGQLTHGQVWSRTLLMSVVSSLTSGLTGLIDALWCLWDPNRQCVHDKVAGTVVITDREPRAPQGSPPAERARYQMPALGWVANGPDPATRPGYPN